MVVTEFGVAEADVGYVAGFITSIIHMTGLFSMYAPFSPSGVTVLGRYCRTFPMCMGAGQS